MPLRTQSLQSTVNSRLTELIECTHLSPEFLTNLRSSNLVTKSDYEELTSFLNSDLHTKGATFLFTSVVTKIAEDDEDKFIDALREGRNERAIDILRSSVPAYVSLNFLESEELKFLECFRNGDYTKKGKFEGLHYADEEIANGLLSESESGETLGGKFVDGEGLMITCEGSEEFIQRVKRSTKCLKDGSLWWNPHADGPPSQLIPRRIRRLSTSDQEENIQLLNELAKVDEPFLWLVDPPGMGKSVVAIELEEEWRRTVPSWRVIVRVNLNLSKDILKGMTKKKRGSRLLNILKCNFNSTIDLHEDQPMQVELSLEAFLGKFVPFLPLDSLCALPGGQVKVIVLLDGLDEVSHHYKMAMLGVLHSLLLSPKKAANRDFTSLILRRPDLRDPLRLNKVFLTTRPHLRNLIEKEFGVFGYRLLPLEADQQIRFLSQEVSEVTDFPQEQAMSTISQLSESARSLLVNPLMLFIFAQVIKFNEGKGESSYFDVFDLYERYISAIHTRHAVEKENENPVNDEAEKRVKSLLDNNLKFYYATALNQIPVPVPGWRGINPRFWGFPTSKEREELLSVGLLTTKSPKELYFLHSSFAEYFHARILCEPSHRCFTGTGYYNLVLFNAPSLLSLAEFFQARILCAPTKLTTLKDAIFRQINLTDSGMTEVFVMCALKRRQEEFPSERLLQLSTGWLPFTTCWLPVPTFWLPISPIWLPLPRIYGKNSPFLLNELLQIGLGLYITWSFRDPLYLVPLSWYLVEVFVMLAAWWKHIQRKRMTLNELQKFLKGRLFLLAGDEVLSAHVDVNNPQVIHNIIKSATDNRTLANVPLLKWIIRKDPKWIRTQLFNLPLYKSNQKWAKPFPQLVVQLLCIEAECLEHVLTEAEISNALSSCDNLVEIVFHHNFLYRHGRSFVENRLGREAMQRAFMTKEFLEFTLDWKEAAWRMAELLTKKEFSSLIAENEDIAMKNPFEFEIVWGGVFIYNRIMNTINLNLNEVQHNTAFEVDSQLTFENICGKFSEGVEGISALRYLLPKVKNTRLLKKLEEMEERKTWDKQEGEFGDSREVNFLETVFGIEGNLWDEMDNLPLEFIPFVIRYGKLCHLKKFFPRKIDRFEDTDTDFPHVCRAFVLSLYLDDRNETFLYLKSRFKSSYWFRQLQEYDMNSFLQKGNVDDLRKSLVSSRPSTDKSDWPLVKNISWGEVLIRLQQNIPEKILEFCVKDILLHLPCCEVPEKLDSLLRDYPSLNELLMSQILFEVTEGRRPDKQDSQTWRCRIRGLIQFLQQNEILNCLWMPRTSTQLYLMNIILEARLPDPHGVSNEWWSDIVGLTPILHEKLSSEFVSESKSPRRLLEIFRHYLTEWEWSVALQTLLIIPNNPDIEEDPSDSQIKIYGEPAIPLLRVWLKEFGVEETRKAAEETVFSAYRGLPGEAVLLAVELGSLKVLKEVALPSLLSWKNMNGQTLQDISLEIWGESHDVTKFLNEKFQLAFNST